MRDRLIELIASKVCSRYSKDTCYSKWSGRCGDCECGRNFQIGDIADHLLENGVIVLPVKVGDVVYTNINGIGLQNSFMVNHVDLLGFSNGLYSWTWHQLGKSVFLTLEQAEKALAERNKV